MDNVTYLIGAGASAKALPVVRLIPSKIEQLLEKLKNGIVHSTGPSIIVSPFPQKLVEDLEWLKKNSEKHSSIDTFAKKLFLIGSPEITRLKYALSGFMSLCQEMTVVDRRYDTFLASILKNKYSEFPNNIKIVSWNYDMQFEKAYYEYLPSNMQHLTLEEVREILNVTSFYNYYDRRRIQHNRNLFEIIKLNGHSTNVIYDEKPLNPPVVSDLLSSSLSENFGKIVSDYPKHVEPGKFKRSAIKFAWEGQSPWDNDGQDNTFINYVKEKISNTQILVVIGYSFPFFNREVDMDIWNSIANNLKKVYIQDIYPEDIKTKFMKNITTDFDKTRIHTLPLEPNTPSEEFYLPPELTL